MNNSSISINRNPRFSSEIERMLLLSFALHVLLIGIIYFNHYFLFRFSKMSVYEVKLVSLPYGSEQSNTFTPPVDKKGDKKSEKKIASKPIKKKEEFRKKEVKVPELKKEEVRSPMPSRKTSESTGEKGESKAAGGFSGPISISSDNFKYPYYEISLRNKIERNWSPPPMIKGSSWVRVVIGRNGRILTTEIIESSGNSFFDQAALRAIYLSDPFPPLPDNYFGSNLMFKVGLEPKED